MMSKLTKKPELPELDLSVYHQITPVYAPWTIVSRQISVVSVLFYSNETPLSAIDEVAKAFYEDIMSTEFDDKVLPEVKSIIADYIRGGE